MGAGMFGGKIKRCQQHIFKVKPQTLDWAEDFAWLSQSRRLSKGYEVSVTSAEAFVRIACIWCMAGLWG